jgi:hypothetical protein
MSEVKKAEGYKCTDGQVFLIKAVAVAHQRELDLFEVFARCLLFYEKDPKEYSVEDIAKELAERFPKYIDGKIKVKLPEEDDE